MTRKTIIAFIILTIAALNVAAQNRQDVVDDGFTWFEAFSTTELTGNNIPTSTGWTLKYWVRTIGNYPDGSGYNFVVSKNGKKVFSTRCDAWAYRRSGGWPDESYLRTAECWQSKSATKETGEFDVAVYTINSQTNAEKLIRTYKIDVRPAARVQVGQGTEFEPPRYYINRHNEAPVAFLFLKPAMYIPYFDATQSPEQSSVNEVELYISLSPFDSRQTIPLGELACTVNGQPLKVGGPLPYATQTSSTLPRYYAEIYQDRLAPKYKAGRPYQDEIRFQMVRFKLPLTFGKQPDGSRPRIQESKGNWQCTIGESGKVWRTFRFSVGADGMPQMHPEQRGNVNLAFNTYLLDVDIPAGGAAIDGRLSGPSNSMFYGLPWSTAEGKSMAARVPKKGNAFPVPSAAPNAVPQ